MPANQDHIAARIRQGSASAFEALFRAHADALCAFAESYVHSQQVAEDLVHDVFCDIWDRHAAFAPQGTVKSYLYRAVRNKALNWLKHQRVQRRWATEQEHAPPPEGDKPSSSTEYDELRGLVAQAIARLSERQQQVYLMARHQDLSYAEIAEILDISPKSVENHMGHALRRLREYLKAFLSLLM